MHVPHVPTSTVSSLRTILHRLTVPLMVHSHGLGKTLRACSLMRLFVCASLTDTGTETEASTHTPTSLNQTITGTVSKATLAKHLRDGVEHVWSLPGALIASFTVAL